ncbi:MAG: hypothetical protein ACTSWW_04080 [Promethearchaeota archaeon]
MHQIVKDLLENHVIVKAGTGYAGVCRKTNEVVIIKENGEWICMGCEIHGQPDTLSSHLDQGLPILEIKRISSDRVKKKIGELNLTKDTIDLFRIKMLDSRRLSTYNPLTDKEFIVGKEDFDYYGYINPDDDLVLCVSYLEEVWLAHELGLSAFCFRLRSRAAMRNVFQWKFIKNREVVHFNEFLYQTIIIKLAAAQEKLRLRTVHYPGLSKIWRFFKGSEDSIRDIIAGKIVPLDFVAELKRPRLELIGMPFIFRFIPEQEYGFLHTPREIFLKCDTLACPDIDKCLFMDKKKRLHRLELTEYDYFVSKERRYNQIVSQYSIFIPDAPIREAMMVYFPCFRETLRYIPVRQGLEFAVTEANRLIVWHGRLVIHDKPKFKATVMTKDVLKLGHEYWCIGFLAGYSFSHPFFRFLAHEIHGTGDAAYQRLKLLKEREIGY